MTPLMKQYWDIKSAHQDKILLFRMGDFFEMFYEDAIQAAPILGITLTQRNKKSQDETPMCGVPHHSIAGPINKLLKNGFRVAICDQVEDPKFAKGIVKRAVTRVLTPGMVYDSDLLDSTRPHYICCVDNDSVSFLDSSTGECFYYLGLAKPQVQQLVSSLNVAEVILEETFSFETNILVTRYASDSVLDEKLPKSANNLKAYLRTLWGDSSLKLLSEFKERKISKKMNLPLSTIKHLEIFENYSGKEDLSFYSIINKTKTSLGARLLRQWILFPLTDINELKLRQNKISTFQSDFPKLKNIREQLAQIGDIERRLGRFTQPHFNARDLQALFVSLDRSFVLIQDYCENVILKENLHKLINLKTQILNSLIEDLPLSTQQGYLFNKNVSVELDELINLSTNGHSLLAELELREKEATGISSLKVRYNNVFGYYIEITHIHKDKVPAHYKRKQTLANAERFYTDELIELEKKILSAQSKRFSLEAEMFEALKKQVLEVADLILQTASFIAEIDVFSSLSWLSIEKNLVSPQFVADDLVLKQSRHLVVEDVVKQKFVANDVVISPSGVLLLTGPNMAGKSTLMRQVALTVLMAQMGSFVPASSAQMPIFDGIYTRIGASDSLGEGLSTFMVEMSETSSVLKQSTTNSLLIIDEIGRGTSTYDGMSLAQAILEYILNHKKCISLFATHYHELTNLDENFFQLKNFHMSITEDNEKINFKYLLKKGPAKKSYGVKVAELAGVPEVIVKRASEILKSIERKRRFAPDPMTDHQLTLKSFEEEVSAQDEKILLINDEIRNLNLNEMTPLKALSYLAEIKNKLN
jgi:DNA mismatch repair protein MutS